MVHNSGIRVDTSYNFFLTWVLTIVNNEYCILFYPLLITINEKIDELFSLKGYIFSSRLAKNTYNINKTQETLINCLL